MTTKHSYNIQTFLSFSVPISSNSSKYLIEANHLHSNQRFSEAKEYYIKNMHQYEKGVVKRLPLYAAVRAGRQTYVVRSSHKHKIAYFPIPKCACTSVSQLLYQVINDRVYVNDDNSKFTGIHEYFHDMSSEISLEKYTDYFKFTVVRDPIERFVSGYRNRIMHHGDVDILLQSMDKTERPKINQFAMNLEEYILRSLAVENHFQPAHYRLGKDLSKFDKVFPIEELKKIPNLVSEMTGRDISLPHAQAGEHKFTIHDLSKESLEFLIQFYQDDYKLLADYYSPEKIREKYNRNAFQSLGFSINLSNV